MFTKNCIKVVCFVAEIVYGTLTVSSLGVVWSLGSALSVVMLGYEES
ncbi:MAG: hypothetical protein P8I55_11035 [Crocinitomix sp.]|nr:hypothetical protein [Crocinitomix sp.]